MEKKLKKIGASVQRMSASDQKWKSVNKTTNTRKGVPVRVTTGENNLEGGGKKKGEMHKLSVPASFPPSSLPFKLLSLLFLLSNRWYTGRARVSKKKRVLILLFSSTTGRLLWVPQHKEMVFEALLFFPSLFLLLEPVGQRENRLRARRSLTFSFS